MVYYPLATSSGRQRSSPKTQTVPSGAGLREMVGGKYSYAVGVVFPFAASFIDRSVGSETSCDLVGRNGSSSILQLKC